MPPVSHSAIERRFASLLEAQGLPRALFPEHLQGFDVDSRTGYLEGRFVRARTLGVPSGEFRASSRITCRIPGVGDATRRGVIEEIHGMSVEREIFGLRAMVPVETVRVTDERIVLNHDLGPETMTIDAVEIRGGV